jgi:hypothetical protein
VNWGEDKSQEWKSERTGCIPVLPGFMDSGSGLLQGQGEVLNEP